MAEVPGTKYKLQIETPACRTKARAKRALLVAIFAVAILTPKPSEVGHIEHSAVSLLP